jgi:hypothetical protein
MKITERAGYSMDEGVGYFIEKIECQYKTTVALTSGDAVRIGALATEENRDQITITNDVTAGLVHMIRGIYQGIGGTGAVNTTTGSPGGRNALASDIVFITTFGVAIGRVDGTTNVAIGDPLYMIGTAGVLKQAASIATPPAIGVMWPVVSLEAYTTDAVDFKKVHVALM